VLLAASNIHSKPTANHNSGLNGKANRHKLATMAPIRKNGFRLPQRGDQVLSEIAPIKGWINKPVTGPARFNNGNSS